MSNKLKFQISYIPNYLIILLGLALLGFYNLILVEFDLTKFINKLPEIVCRLLSLIMLLFAWSNLVYENKKLKNVEFIELHVENKKRESEIKSNINEYAAIDNFKRKKEVFLKKITKDLYKLDKKASSTDNYIFYYGTLDEKIKNKYCVKKMNLMKKQTDEYINKNLKIEKVKFNPIEIVDLYQPRESLLNGYDDLKKRKATKQLRLMFPKIILAAALSIMLSLTGMDFVYQFNMVTVIELIMDLFFIIGIILFGNSAGSTLFEIVDMDYEIKKKLYLENYFEWNSKQPNTISLEKEQLRIEYEKKAKEAFENAMNKIKNAKGNENDFLYKTEKNENKGFEKTATR